MKSITWTLKRYSIQILLSLMLITIILILRSLSNTKVLLVNLHPKPLKATDAELVILPEEYVDSQRAFCLDGSRPGYYIRYSRLPSNNKWILHLPKGSWCDHAEDCERRSKTNLGSTSFNSKVRTLGGIMSADVNINPDFYHWNVVDFVYCDGCSFLGNLSEPVVQNGKLLYLRGAVIFEVIVRYLLDHTPLSRADQVLFIGSSAGSLGASVNIDQLIKQLPRTVLKIHLIMDAGIFVDQPDINEEYKFKNRLKGLFEFHNIKDSQGIQKCTNEQQKKDKWKCLLPEVFHHYVSTPSYYLNSYYDTWYSRYELKINCLTFKTQCSINDQTVIQKVAHSVINVSDKLVKKDGVNGIYLTKCVCHTLLNTNTNIKMLSQGLTPIAAVKLWLQQDNSVQKVTEFGPLKYC